jgi:hypothetical protein
MSEFLLNFICDLLEVAGLAAFLGAVLVWLV